MKGWIFAVLGIGAALAIVWRVALWMPGPMRPPECAVLELDPASLESRLEQHVRVLAQEIGARSAARPRALAAAAGYVIGALADSGWTPSAERFGPDGEFLNVVAERPGTDLREQIVVVGAHYDSVAGSPGADDNASGVAALLELARALVDLEPRRTLRLIAFTNEELPLGASEHAGSRVEAARSRERGERIAAMLSLESLGIYSDEPGSQRYPARWLGGLFPDRADYLAWVADLRSRALLHRALGVFRAADRLPSEGMSLAPALLPDLRRSDHAAYWDQGYPALLVTGTAEFRNPNYHAAGDVPERLDFARLARATAGIAEVVACLATGSGW